MSNNPWQSENNEQDFDPISFIEEWIDPDHEEEDLRSEFFQGLDGRRRKAAFVLMAIWGTTLLFHLVAWSSWLFLCLTTVIFLQACRLVLAKPQETPYPLTDEQLANAPTVSLMVAAKNEAVVIGNLIKQLGEIDYPTEKYDIWIIDDNSDDETPAIIDKLALKYPQLNVVHRSAQDGGGKSGALNQVLPLTKGEIIGVFDADATVPQDLLRAVVPIFAKQQMGAVQVRKAIANKGTNFWTDGQQSEMSLDSYFQQQRIASGGMGELRGNGQFVRRTALVSCGGWNEETITDDLDLTIRLHLDQWEIGLLPHPDVKEEGVTTAIALWHQRNRWAEGGYQRYLDYWRFILSRRLGFRKKLDLAYFLLVQYLLPTAAIPDVILALTRHRLPIYGSLSGILVFFSFIGMIKGLKRTQKLLNPELSNIWSIFRQSLRGTLYMMHWFVIIPSITARMSIRQKRLKWVKTTHEGTEESQLEFENC
ncbi:MAG: glycosyltransferase family 2 protein [Microcystaceae cyanobacterium]